jgi:hypothetical protein
MTNIAESNTGQLLGAGQPATVELTGFPICVKQILAPTDLSEDSRKGLRYATGLGMDAIAGRPHGGRPLHRRLGMVSICGRQRLRGDHSPPGSPIIVATTGGAAVALAAQRRRRNSPIHGRTKNRYLAESRADNAG